MCYPVYIGMMLVFVRVLVWDEGGIRGGQGRRALIAVFQDVLQGHADVPQLFFTMSVTRQINVGFHEFVVKL